MLSLGEVRVHAQLEENDEPELPERFVKTMRDMTGSLLKICAAPERRGDLTGRQDVDTARGLIRSLVDGLSLMNLELEADVSEEGADGPSARTALLAWLRANRVTARALERIIDSTETKREALLNEAVDAVDGVLRELAPERFDQSAAHAASRFWAAPTKSQAWARYRDEHRRITQRYARRPSFLLGNALSSWRDETKADSHKRYDEPIEPWSSTPRSQSRIAIEADTGRTPSSH